MSRIIPERLQMVEEKADIVLQRPKPTQIKKYVSTGDRVSYVGNDNKYRSGGFVMTISEDGETMSLSGGRLRWSVSTSFIRQLFVSKKE